MNKKYNIADLREAFSECCAPAVIDFHGLKLSIEKNISVSDRVDLISTVVSNCLSTEEPIAVFDYMFRFCVIEWFTDIDLSGAGENEDAIIKSDILDAISANTCCSIRELREDCRLELDRFLRYVENPVTRLAEEILSWLDSMKETADGIDLNKMKDLISDIQNVSPDNVVDIVNRLHGGDKS